MSKKDQLENLAIFIGLKAAHEIVAEFTNKPESIPHLEQEADTYGKLSFDLAEGNWNIGDIETIKELARKRCNKKLGKYEDIADEKYNKVENIIKNIMKDLELI